MPKSQFMEGLLAGIAERDRRLEREAAERARSMQYLLQNRQLGQTDVAQAEIRRRNAAEEKRSLDLLQLQRDELVHQVKGQERDDLFKILQAQAKGEMAPVPTQTIEAPFTGVEIKPQQMMTPEQSVGIEVGGQRFAPTSPEYQARQAVGLETLRDTAKFRAGIEERKRMLNEDLPYINSKMGLRDRELFVSTGKVPDINNYQELIVNEIQNGRINRDQGYRELLGLYTAQRQYQESPAFKRENQVLDQVDSYIGKARDQLSRELNRLEGFPRDDNELRKVVERASALAAAEGNGKLTPLILNRLEGLRLPSPGKVNPLAPLQEKRRQELEAQKK